MSVRDYTDEDVGNIVSLEHVNLYIPSQELAILFYVVGLGFTRDPYLSVGTGNMWINIGEQQFHLPTRGQQVIPGTIGIVVPDLELLQVRLKSIEERLTGTQFSWSLEDNHVMVICPWGNRFRCHCPDAKFGDTALGLLYVEFYTRPRTAAGIGRFYREVMGAPSVIESDEGAPVARIAMGRNQWLYFRETQGDIPPYDGHHIAVYIANFSSPYGFLKKRKLIMEDVANHQFRFKEVVDPKSDKKLFTLEHEVRSLRHPLYRRFLVNRDPTQVQSSYSRGRDALIPMVKNHRA